MAARMVCFLLLTWPCLEAPAQEIRFKDVTRTAGLFEPLAGIMGHGAAWGDFEGNGRLGLFVGGFCDRPDRDYLPHRGPVPSRLFRNLGNGKFEPVKDTPASFFGRTSGAVLADLDNNGTLELYAANNARPAKASGETPQEMAKKRFSNLFRNDNGKLIDISLDSGACPTTLLSARNIGVFDYDGDGLLDLLVIEDRFTRKPRCTLFKNMGGLKFKDVTKEAGLPEDMYGLGLAVADVNGDGKPDFFVPHSNRFFLSTKSGKYIENAELNKTFAWDPLDREDWPCGAVFGDLNRDGLPDLVLSIHGKKARNRVFINEGLRDGVPRFRDVTREVGMPAVVPVKCPHVEIQDFDNDGWPDIYLSAAWMDKDGSITPLVLRNTGVKDGLPRFVAPRPVEGEMVYFPAGPSGDFDGDGRVDLFLVNWFAGNHCRLLRNDSPKRHWLDVQVVGKKMNRMGIGAVVRLTRAGKPNELLGRQEVSTGYGYASGQPAVCHFGMGDVTEVDVEVRLPHGPVIRQTSVKADQKLVVREE